MTKGCLFIFNCGFLYDINNFKVHANVERFRAEAYQILLMLLL